MRHHLCYKYVLLMQVDDDSCCSRQRDAAGNDNSVVTVTSCDACRGWGASGGGATHAAGHSPLVQRCTHSTQVVGSQLLRQSQQLYLHHVGVRADAGLQM